MENMEVMLCDEKQFLCESLENISTLESNVNQKWTQFHIKENIINPVVNSPILEEHACIFCLDPGETCRELIQFCSCSVMAHKTCAIQYITYPGSLNDKCCMCRKKLEYHTGEENTPMKMKYSIILTAIIISVMLVSSASLYIHLVLIPKKDWNTFVYVCAIGNLSMFYPLMYILFIGFIIDYHSPRGSMSDSICYCGHEDIPLLNYQNWRGGRGVEFGLIFTLCLILVMSCVVMVGIAYISYGILKFYRSFKLKSKKDIYFYHERPVNQKC